MALTDTAIRKAKPNSAPVKLSDGGGLHLLITPHGSKLWRMAYRFAGKQKTLAIGIYPAVSLAEARTARDGAKKLLAKGLDPSANKRADRIAAQIAANITFGSIADDLIAKAEREEAAESTVYKLNWLVGLARPALGNTPIAQISAVEVLGVLRKIEARGRYDTAKRLRNVISQVFRLAIASGKAIHDPTTGLRNALISHKVKHRPTIVDPVKIGGLLRAIDGYDGHPTVRLALQLAPLLFVRPGELRYAEWSEFNLEKAEWIIPAAKMKMRRSHGVPLSSQAIVLLRRLREISDGKLLFPSIRSVTRPISENTLNAALRRLGYGTHEMTAHGFRAMASTRLNEMSRWNPDAIERQLAHQEENDTRRAYTHSVEYWNERVEMMQVWADYLDNLRESGFDQLNKVA